MTHQVPTSLSQQAADALEWPRLLELLAQHAQSSMGAANCRALPLAETLKAARLQQQRTSEVMALMEGTEPFPSLAFPDIRDAVSRSSKGGVLEAHELRDCSLLLGTMDRLGRFLTRQRERAPALAATVEPLRAMKGLLALQLAIDAAIQPDGALKESATPELRRLSHVAHDLKQEIRQRLEHLLHSPRFEEVLQERYFAQREGRYVLPVKADMRGRIPGIVHDVSASGATVFLEPRELVELNNAIKVADLEVEREVRRILRELSARVAAQAEPLRQGMDILAEVDCVHAKAVFGDRLHAGTVALNDGGRIVLKQARHPLLVLTKDSVVANDIVMDDTVRVLIISGPNTGGKTVTLKIVGLFALMVRAGVPVPCAPDSEMALFTELYADIGDAQDLSRDLSSFSAHITQMVRLLAEAGNRPGAVSSAPRSLVLLDEPVTSTDPREGAALAEALLRRLAALNLKVVATTHYGALKELAQTEPGFANASVEFDVARMAPTYRLFMGLPGGSSALEIAARLGMEDSVLRDARGRVHHHDERRLDAVMADLQARQRRLIDEVEQAARARKQAEQAAREAEALRAQLEQTEREARKGIKKKLSEQFQQARAEVQAMVDALKREQRLIKAQETKARLSALEQQARARLAPVQEPIPIEQLTAGATVEIGGLGMTGVLLEAPQGKKRVRVRVGEGEVVATVSNLVGLAQLSDEPGAPSSAPQAPVRSAGPAMDRDEHTVVDVRGHTADDALDQVVAALDRAALSGAPFLRIIHGHGTGRLKTALREYLQGSPYVEEFRPGDRAEGGDGVTVAKLR